MKIGLNRVIAMLVVIILSGTSFHSALAQVLSPAEKSQVEKYLNSLGLESLGIEFLEQQIERELDRELRKKYAARLAGLYTKQLVSPSSTYEESLQWQLKAQQLVQIYPELDDPVLQIAIFHARYQSVYKDFEQWWQGGRQGPSQLAIADSLRQLIRDLLQLDRRMETNRQNLSVNLQFQGATSGELEVELARVENVLLHTKYLVGWASYFRSIVQPENATEWLVMADNNFRSFLQIAPNKPLLEVEESWFDFENVWTSRGLIGLALCKLAEEQKYLSDYCLNLARKDKNDGDVGKLIEVWELKGLFYSNKLNAAYRLINQKLNDGTNVSAPFWSEAIKNGASILNRETKFGGDMIRAGLIGLTRQRQPNLILSTLEELNLSLGGSDFVSKWISGFLDFSQAEQEADRNKYESAKIRLAQAIEAVKENTDPQDVARCEFLLATIRFRNREYEQAESMFARVTEVLKTADRQVAALAMWRRAQSLTEVSRKDPRRSSQAFSVLDQFVRQFPDSPMVDRVEFEKLKLSIQSLPDGEAVRQLGKVVPASDYYIEARYEMVQRQYRCWLDAKRRKRPVQPLLEKLLELEEEYYSDESASGPRKLRLRLLVIDALLRQDTVPISDVLERLSLAAITAEANRDTQEELYLEYRFTRFRFLQLQDPLLAVDEAKWIVENAAGKTYEQSALVFLAGQLKTPVAGSNLDGEKFEEGIRIYQRLVAINGSSPEQLKSSNNARVASTRLADLYTIRGDWARADTLYSNLLACFPNNPGYLAAAGRAKTNLGLTSVALPIWRKLAFGVEAGTELWYESKYQLAACLAQDDQSAAAKLLRQTIQLSPEMPEAWRVKYQQLQSDLDAGSK